MDFALSAGFVIAAVGLAIAYAVAVRLRGRRTYPRLDREASSALLRRGAMEPLYAVMVSVGEIARRLEVSPNAVTWASLVLGAGAGALLAGGYFGGAAVAAALAGGCDALDGWLARETGKATPSGAIFDTTADRYVELLFFAGLAFHYRGETVLFVLVMAALVGAFMVSYASAKADGSGVDVPRGTMRRGERMIYLVGAVALVPLVRAVSPALADAPIALALCLIGVLGNASAVHRMHALGRALDVRAGKARDGVDTAEASSPPAPHASRGAVRFR